MAVAAYTQPLPLVAAGGIVGGFGFGASFSGALRTIGPLAKPAERAGLFAGVYVVAYLAFGVPAIVAGFLVSPIGLLPTIIGYGAVTLLSASVGLGAQLRRIGRWFTTAAVNSGHGRGPKAPPDAPVRLTGGEPVVRRLHQSDEGSDEDGLDQHHQPGQRSLRDRGIQAMVLFMEQRGCRMTPVTWCRFSHHLAVPNRSNIRRI